MFGLSISVSNLKVKFYKRIKKKRKNKITFNC